MSASQGINRSTAEKIRLATKPGARVVFTRPCEWAAGCSGEAKGQQIYCSTHQITIAEQTSHLEKLVAAVRDYVFMDDTRRRRGLSRVRRDSAEFERVRSTLGLAEDALRRF
jgi:hypothetical protein